MTSPALPESAMSDEEALEQGELSGKAAQVLMRLLWLARQQAGLSIYRWKIGFKYYSLV